MTKTTHRGSCHCGAVRFDCELDLAEGTSKCNCSMHQARAGGTDSTRARSIPVQLGIVTARGVVGTVP
jgi:hypothetical protein